MTYDSSYCCIGDLDVVMRGRGMYDKLVPCQTMPETLMLTGRVDVSLQLESGYSHPCGDTLRKSEGKPNNSSGKIGLET